MWVDPLEGPGSRRLIVVATAIAAVTALAGSASSDVPEDLPGIALGSPGLLHVERALIVGATVAGALIFLLRGWAGYFPSKLSTAGAEYAARAAADETARTDDEIIAALIRVEVEGQTATASLRKDIHAVRRQIDSLVRDESHV